MTWRYRDARPRVEFLNLILNPIEASYGVERGLLTPAELEWLERSGLIRSGAPGWALSRDDHEESLGASPRREHARNVWWIVELLRLRQRGWKANGSRASLSQIDADHSHPEPLAGFAAWDGVIPRSRIADVPGLVTILEKTLDAELRLRGTALKAVSGDLLYAFVELPCAFIERVARLHPAELRAGVDLGLCSPAAARTLFDRGLVRDDLALAAFDERPSFSPQRTNPGWIWYLLHSRWLFETGLTANETLDAVAALNADFGHPQAFEYHPSDGPLLLPPIRFPRIVEAWARALADEFDSRPTI